MAEVMAPSLTATAAPRGLLARVFGVLLAPRATYADVAARPRWLGVLKQVFTTPPESASRRRKTHTGRG